MDQGLLAILLVVVVAAVALWLRRGSQAVDTARVEPPARDEPPAPYRDAVTDESGDEATEAGAFTSDGWAFVPDGNEVHLVPPASEEDEVERVMAAAMGQSSETPLDGPGGVLGRDSRHRGSAPGKPGEHLDVGDLIGARVVRGAPDTDPWRLEALGREGEYRAWAFETEDAARTAHGLLERRIVRPPLDDDGEPSPPLDEDYATALALTQAGIADVATDPGDDEPRP